MKSAVRFPISQNCKILVDVGDSVSSDTVLLEEFSSKQKEVVPISKLLNVKGDSIYRHLRKKIGEQIEMGEILATSKTFFSSKSIKSPVAGTLSEIDLSFGTLTLVAKSGNVHPRKIKSPIKGKVKNITKTAVEIEVEGEVLDLVRGFGEERMGKLVYMEKEDLGILDVVNEVENCIVSSHQIPSDVMVKLEVMGAAGLVVVKEPKGDLPWGQIEVTVFKKLKAVDGKMVWLRPEVKQLVVID
jgi:hypothetical protein